MVTLALRFIFCACCLMIGALWTSPVAAHVSPAVLFRHVQQSEVAARKTVDPFDTLVVLISRSTNTCAVTMTVSSGGTISLVRCNRTTTHQLSEVTVSKFFDDVNSATPLTSLTERRNCIKPVSFATTTHIVYGTQISPDISCSGDDMGQKLYHDVFSILSSL
ncbi:hypothetical protein KDA_42440 [Dictyobacter alpinus]|uniref:Uncharacterized protein n=1 Tax=Dictyobacter alpinus TaxID=2014873 RepID=A0A402BBT6_9CHLR|nr:hypothetical protein [Dictyobacter alpinus]GCE28760.1 hypothetical protein KDA_42440 [Dictyobacter alpinus]